MKFPTNALVVSLLVIACMTACKKKDDDAPATTNPEDTTPKKSWKTIGGKIAAKNNNAHATIVVDKDAIPYVIYQDGNNADKATVVKLQDSSWAVVGKAGFSNGAANRPSIVLNSTTGLPFVTFIETSTTAANKVVVMQFDGNEWAESGSTYFQANGTCTPSLALDNNGQPSVAFVAPPFTGKAMGYDGMAWTETFASPTGRRVYDIDITSGMGYLSYLWDSTLGVTQISVLNNTTGSWSDLNFPKSINPTTYFISTDNNNTPFIAIEGKAPIRQASVMNFSGGWSNIGAKDFTSGIASDPYLRISGDSDNTPYLAFRDGNNQATVMYKKSENWTNYGIGFPKITASFISLDVDPQEHLPYIAVTNTFDGSISILRYE